MEKNTEKKRGITGTAQVAFLAMICCVLWGSAFPCVKIGYELFAVAGDDSASQILFAGLRFTLAGLLTIAIASLLKGKPVAPARTSWGMVFTLCAFQTVIQYLFFYMGLAHASGVRSSIITGSNVFIAILLACFIFRQEEMTRAKLIGCILGFAGVVLVNWDPGSMGESMRWDGEGFIFLAAVSYAMSSVLIKKYSLREDPMVLSGYQFFAGGIIMDICGLLMGGHLQAVSPYSLAMLLYLGFVSAAAYSLWAVLLKYNPVSKVTIFGFMNPVCGVLLSALLLGEQEQAFGIRTLCALAFVSAGIYITNSAASSSGVRS